MKKNETKKSASSLQDVISAHKKQYGKSKEASKKTVARAAGNNSARQNPGDQEIDDKKRKILETAARLIRDRSFDGTSMSAISDAMDMTKAGLYYHIRDKQDLLFNIVSYAMYELESKVMRPAGKIPDPAERLRFIVGTHARLVVGDTIAVAILAEQVERLNKKEREQIDLRRRAYFDLIRDTLIELEKKNQLQEVDPTAAAFSMLGALLWIPKWFKKKGRLSADEAAASVSKFILCGLLKS